MVRRNRLSQILAFTCCFALLFSLVNCSSDEDPDDMEMMDDGDDDGGDDDGGDDDGGDDDGGDDVVDLSLEAEVTDPAKILSYLGSDDSGDQYKVDIDSSGVFMKAESIRDLLDLPDGTNFFNTFGAYHSLMSLDTEGSFSVHQVNMKNNVIYKAENFITFDSGERYVDLISTNNRLMVVSLTNHTDAGAAQNFLRIYNKTTGELEMIELPPGGVVTNSAVYENHLIVQTLSTEVASIVQSIDFVNAEVVASREFPLPISGTIVDDELHIMGLGRSYDKYDPITLDFKGNQNPSFFNFPEVGFFETSSSGSKVALDYRWAAPTLQSVAMVPVLFDLSTNQLDVDETVFLQYFKELEGETIGVLDVRNTGVSVPRDLVIVSYADNSFIPLSYGLRYLSLNAEFKNEITGLQLRPDLLFID